MAQAKPLFVPWLYDQIKSGSYPGVCWTNEELSQFSIPWKHALRQDSNSEDVLIFKAWAQTSTSADSRRNGDPSVWKRNFRSALRAKGFTMIYDNKNDAANPHKVYQFPSDPHSVSGSEGSQDTDFSPDLYGEEPQVFTVLNFGDIEHDFTGLKLQENPSQVAWNPSEIYLGLDDQQLFQQTSSDLQFSGMPEYPALEAFAPAVTAVGQVSPSEGPAAVSPHSPEYQTDCEGAEDQLTIPQPKLETFFRIKIFFRGKAVSEQLVENDAGFRLRYTGNRDESVRVDEDGLTVVTIPPVEDMPDQLQAKHTSDILENLGSLEIRRLDGVIYGHRSGSSKIYWGLCKHERTLTPRELDKTHQPLYLIKDYVSGLMAFIQTNGETPSYALYFFLGEKWPDPKKKPWEKKLIMIEVVLTSLEDLKNLAVIHGASSLQSVELQLSLEQMMELC